MSALAPLVANVDDDAPIRRALTPLICSAGYEATAFAPGTEFLDSLPVDGRQRLDAVRSVE